MIKAVFNVNGRKIVVLGLTSENVIRLQEGRPIAFNGNVVGLGDMTLSICYGDTGSDIAQDLRVTGLMDHILATPPNPGVPLQPEGEREPIDVRAIVLDVIENHPDARRLYLNDTAVHYGVEMTVKVLERAAARLTRSGRFTRAELVDLLCGVAEDGWANHGDAERRANHITAAQPR